MDVELNDGDRRFVDEVRAFIKANLASGTRGKVLRFELPDRQERTVWQRALVARSWGASTWRTGIARVSQSRREIARLKALAKSRPAGNATLYDHPLFRAGIACLEIVLTALDVTARRMISALSTDTARKHEASLLKIKGSELQQDISEAMMDAAGAAAWRGRDRHPQEDFATAWNEHAEHLSPSYFNQRKVTIYGGSNEIQRNILAKTMIGP